jgi:hypothetical protein
VVTIDKKLFRRAKLQGNYKDHHCRIKKGNHPSLAIRFTNKIGHRVWRKPPEAASWRACMWG